MNDWPEGVGADTRTEAERMFDLRLKTGLPPDQIAANVDELEQRVAREEADARKLRSTLNQARKTMPDTAARVFELRLKTGLPAPVIERNIDEIERRAARADFDAPTFRRTYPKLAEWLV